MILAMIYFILMKITYFNYQEGALSFMQLTSSWPRLQTFQVLHFRFSHSSCPVFSSLRIPAIHLFLLWVVHNRILWKALNYTLR